MEIIQQECINARHGRERTEKMIPVINDKVEFGIELSNEMYDQLKRVSEITGKSIDRIIEEAIDRYISPFRASYKGDVIVQRGRIHPTEYEKQYAREEGFPEPACRNCYVLGHENIYTDKYTKVYYEGRFLKVPSEQVEEME